jgi:hypothetical protein
MIKALEKFFSNEGPLTRIVYISQCNIPGTPAEVASQVQRIVDHAQVYNSKNNITGLLLFSGSHFAQVLEGPSHNVKTLFESIETDNRHSNSQTLVNHEVDARAFGKWDMALTSVNQQDMADVITLFPTSTSTANGKDKLIVSLMQSHLDYYGEMNR